MIRRVRPSYTYQAVEVAIKEYIVERSLQPGDALPSERELCQILGVSRTSVREGLRSLSMMGLIDVRTGEGTFVRSIDIGKHIKELSSLLLSDHQNILDLQEVREALEVMACRRAATRITPDQLEGLARNLDAYKAALDADEDGLQQDIEFHNIIFQASDNRFLRQLADSIADLVRVIRLTGLRLMPRPYMAVEQHGLIYQALADHDPEEAARAMQVHMRQVSHNLRIQREMEKQ